MNSTSLLCMQRYSLDWVKDFYDQGCLWWGGSEADEESWYEDRAAAVERLCGPNKRVLDLGPGAAGISGRMADHGHTVIGVEISPVRVRYAQAQVNRPRAAGSLTIVEGDFYTVELEGRFDVVCHWGGFGIGSDADQRRLLRRSAHEWLGPGGCVLMDVYSPVPPTRRAGTAVHLDALEGVPESVEMIERTYYDPIYGRWIDEWQPVAEPEQALAQSVRCYTPADLLLLLEGTGLALQRLEVNGQALDLSSQAITTSGPWVEASCYQVQLVPCA